MKVTGQQPPGLAELNAGKTREKAQQQKIEQSRAQRGQEHEPAANRTTSTSDKVRAAIRNEPDVRADRVAEVRERLRSGKFTVNPDKLAESMLLASLKEDVEKP